MSKLSAFVHLDFITVKPYVKVLNLMVFLVVALYLSFMFGSISSGLFIGTMLSVVLISYVFVASEKHNMDALYITLAAGKNTVVAGRYLFLLLLNVCLVIVSCAVSAVIQFVRMPFGISTSSGGIPLGVFLIASAALIIVQAIQIPFYFRLGYTKAKFVSFLPFCLIFGGSLLLNTLTEETFEIIVGKNGVIAICAALIAVVIISYRLSAAFYSKREF